MTYKATVRHGKVVVDVDLPNGTAVKISVERDPEKLQTYEDFEAYVDEVVREGDAAIARGEWFTTEEVFEHLRRQREALLRNRVDQKGVDSTRRDRDALDRSARRSTKRAAKRAR
jgi:hypothetical protein